MIEQLNNHKCPYCGRGEFFKGPSGGTAFNIECKHCGSRYNVAVWQGKVFHAEPIAYNGLWPDRGDW